MSRRWGSVAEIIQANREAGQFWFDDATLEWFKSMVYRDTLIAGRYFITSEQPPDAERKFSVRVADDQGVVSTVGEFWSHRSKEAAIAAALREAAANE